MKIKSLILLGMAVLGSAFAFVGCGPDEPEVVFEFNVTAPDGKSVTETSQFTFGEVAAYPFTAKALQSVEATGPKGWQVAATTGSKTISVTAPDAKDASAATKGDIVVKATSTNGQSKEVTLKVEVVDADIVFTVKDIAASVDFFYGGTAEYTVESTNVETVEATAPKGWKVDATPSAVKVAAPARTDATAETTGKITLTPKSARGNSGTAVSFDVNIVVSAPSIAFDAAAASRVKFGSTTTLTAKDVANVEKVDITKTPEGWKAAYDLSKKTLTITAPAFDANSEGSGDIIVLATSKSGDTVEATVPVSLVGINNLLDIATLATGGDPTPFVYNNEIVLNNDLDLSDLTNNVFIPKLENAAINGRNHTITFNISTTEAQAGLIGEAENVVIKNLKTAGAIMHTGQSVKVTMAPIALFAKNITLENVSNYAKLTQTGTNEDSWGYVAGLICDIQSDSKLTNCHNYGAITCVSPKYFGGLVASIWDKTKGEMNNCSNEGNITFNFNNLKTGGMMAGGVVGTCAGSDWKFINCFNKGDISYDLKEQGIRVLGGFVGMAQGYYENCYNTGNITNRECLTSVQKDTRRVGGFAGGVWESNGYTHHSKNCYNTGNVTEIGDYIGGFIGMSEYKSHFENDYNSGNVTSVSQNDITYRCGGFGGGIWEEAVLENCTNKGKVICCSKRVAAGLAVVGDSVKLIGCVNEGEVKVGANEAALNKAWSPIVGGLCAISGDGATVTIEKCKNTGAITAMTQHETLVQSLYVSEGYAHKLGDPTWEGSDKTVCDQKSKDDSAAAKVTYIAKANWSNNTILGWLK